MSNLKNKVSSQLPQITTYTAEGNITGVVTGNVTATGNLTGSGMTITGNAIITGNANVQGTLTYNNTTSITTDNLVIGLGNSQTGINVTGGGMVVGNTAEAQFLYNQPAQTWDSNLGIDATGNITAAYFIGNGSQLTGLPAGYADSNVTTLLASGTVTSNVVTTGNISGNYVLGNGSQLTGLAPGNSINNGTSNVRIATANGNVTMSVANVADVVTVTGNSLRVNGNIFDASGQVYTMSASFAKYTRTTTQTGVTANTPVVFNVLESQFGSDIAVDTATGSFTLQPGKTYRLRGTVGFCDNTSATGAMTYQWWNVTAGAWVGQGGGIISVDGTGQGYAWQSGTAEYVFTATVTTTVQLRVVGVNNASIILSQTGASNISSWKIGSPFADIQVIGAAAPLTNVGASFAKYTRTTNQTSVVANSAVVCNVMESTFGSDITVNATTGNITLEANRTYRLRGGIGATDLAGGRTSYQWFNATANAWIGQATVAFAPTSAAGQADYQGSAECVITPGVTTVVQLRVGQTSGTATLLVANAQNTDAGAPFIDIQVIGQPAPITGEPVWTSAGTIQAVGIGGTTTAPTLASSATKNNLSYKQIGAKTWQVQAIYEQPNSTGANAGSGDYLFTLPLGLQFDTTLPYQAAYQLFVGTNSAEFPGRTIPGSESFLTNNSSVTGVTQAGIIPWDATRYRVFLPIQASGFLCWGSGFFPPSTGILRVNWTMTFQST
jgi:hypothetical protein